MTMKSRVKQTQFIYHSCQLLGMSINCPILVAKLPNTFAYAANMYTISVARIYLINKQYIILRITQKVNVVCSAISIKEAMILCPFTTFICDSIKFGNDITFAMTHRQCIAIGEVLGELGFVNDMGENPLDLIQDKNVEELEQSIAEQRPE